MVLLFLEYHYYFIETFQFEHYNDKGCQNREKLSITSEIKNFDISF